MSQGGLRVRTRRPAAGLVEVLVHEGTDGMRLPCDVADQATELRLRFRELAPEQRRFVHRMVACRHWANTAATCWRPGHWFAQPKAPSKAGSRCPAEECKEGRGAGVERTRPATRLPTGFYHAVRCTGITDWSALAIQRGNDEGTSVLRRTVRQRPGSADSTRRLQGAQIPCDTGPRPSRNILPHHAHTTRISHLRDALILSVGGGLHIRVFP